MKSSENKGSVFWGMVWMFVISTLLFWLPIAGPFLGGIAGGKKAGSVGRAILAVFLPGIVFGVILFLNAAVFTGLPLIGFVAGFGGFALCAANIGPLLVGAILGGLLAEV